MEYYECVTTEINPLNRVSSNEWPYEKQYVLILEFSINYLILNIIL